MENKEAVYWLSVLLVKLELRQEVIEALKMAINALLPDDIEEADDKRSILEKLQDYKEGEIVCTVTILGKEVPVSRDMALRLLGCKPEVARNE
jgi:hypothetical protein